MPDLPHLVGLGVAATALEVDPVALAWVSEEVMATANSLDEP